MRLIDADKFFNDMYDMCKTKAQFVRGLGEIVNVVDVLEQIINTPTIDAVPVVRCKDCKWSDWYTAPDGHTYCHCMETGNGGRTENDYCSYGEREDGEV